MINQSEISNNQPISKYAVTWYKKFETLSKNAVFFLSSNILYSQSKRYSPSVDIVLSFQYYYHRDDFSFDGTGGTYSTECSSDLSNSFIQILNFSYRIQIVDH